MMALVAFGIITAFGVWLTFTGENPDMILRGIGLLIAGSFGLVIEHACMMLAEVRNALLRLNDTFEDNRTDRG